MWPGGTVLVVDERAAGSFTASGGETGRLFAPASAIWCLPQGRGGPDPELAGSLICPAAMRDLACRSGQVTNCRRYQLNSRIDNDRLPSLIGSRKSSAAENSHGVR